jgi:hypothetical protein
MKAMKSTQDNGLALEDLEICQFRCFDELKIEKLGRVNLFVGKNNVGKSSLLEALRIYATGGAPSVLLELVTARDENQDTSVEAQADLLPDPPFLLNLFHGRKDIRSITNPIQVGSKSSKLSISLGWYRDIPTPAEEGRRLEPVGPSQVGHTRDGSPFLVIKGGINGTDRLIPLHEDESFYRRWTPADVAEPCVFVGANGIRGETLARMWDKIALSRFEDEVTESLRLIAPEVERISFVGSDRREGRTPRVRIRGLDRPVPLRSMGDGANRLFGMMLAMVTARDGLLLLDEVENGIHYSIQRDLWRSLLQRAASLNVQVFATTHSWDCVKAFHVASHENHREHGILTRLESRRGSVVASQFDEAELDIATRESIEIR